MSKSERTEVHEGGKEDAWLKKLKMKEWNAEELNNLYTNAIEKKFIRLAKAIHEQLRANYPGVATRRFGAKDEKARELLNEVYKETAAQHDLSKNKVRNGVKTGGLQLSGEKYINVYISYKNSNGHGIALGLFQDKLDEAINVELVAYKVGVDNYRNVRHFPFCEFQNMAQKYKDCVAQILSSHE